MTANADADAVTRERQAPFALCRPRAVVQVDLVDGRSLTGSYMTVAGLDFLYISGPDLPLTGIIEGPFEPASVLNVHVLQTRAQVMAGIEQRRLGERVPGREPFTRQDFEYRLFQLARLAAAEQDGTRQRQLIAQFDSVANRIRLAQAKRVWIHAEAKWSLSHNAPPTMRDLWIADVASPSLFRRPNPEDFDPDPAVRRRRRPLPPEILRNPASVPNMARALRAIAGVDVRLSLAGDPPWSAAELDVRVNEIPGAIFRASGRLGPDGRMAWQLGWGGNGSQRALRRCRRAMDTAAYRQARDVITRRSAPAAQDR